MFAFSFRSIDASWRELIFGSPGQVRQRRTLRLDHSFVRLHGFEHTPVYIGLIRKKKKNKRANGVRNPSGLRRSLVYYGYVVGAISLIPGWFGFDFLYRGLDAWSRGWGYRDLLISPLLAVAFALGYGSAAMTIGNHKKTDRNKHSHNTAQP